jgi:hypothetical protein
MTAAEERKAQRTLGRIAARLKVAGTRGRPGRKPESLAGRAFSLMLDVKRALTTNMQLHAPSDDFPEGGYTILESSEDRAADLLERAIRGAERRGERRRPGRACASCSKPAIAGMMATPRRSR